MQAAFIFTITAGIVFVGWIFGLYRCPSEFIFGVPCPLCGISRAFKSLLSGNIRAAFYYHPLWPVILLSLILYILCTLRIIRPGKRVFNAACIILAVMLLGCFILRHINGSPVVQTHFDESLIGWFLQYIR